MSTTTDILFNSPALHSLKRDQLVKLCKVHSIKASGKNVELIEKLKKYAETLPRDSPLSVAARSEELAGNKLQVEDNSEEVDQNSQVSEEDLQSANARWGFQMPRPSEQWEVVMESIDEAEERSSQGTLNSIRTIGSNGTSGEFGTAVSKSSSVSSSIKALASSLGWKRDNMSKSTLMSSSFPPVPSSKLRPQSSSKADDELIQNSVPYSALPDSVAPPQTDHFTFDRSPDQRLDGIHSLEKTSPLPGHSLRPGVPVPVNARLSLGLNAPSTPTRKSQPTTTIRLISNPASNDSDSPYGRTPQLKPFKTSFDLVLGSPSASNGNGINLWPKYDDYKGIYPSLAFDTPSVPTVATSALIDVDMDVPLPGSLSSVPKSLLSVATPLATTNAQLAVPEPFVFGSPLPQHNVSDTQFKSAATSVLAEMNKRLKDEGVAVVGMDLIGKLQLGAHTQIVAGVGGNETKDIPKTSGLKEKFDEIHAEEFNKMEGIDSLVRRRAMGGKGGTEIAVTAAKKRKSSIGHGAGRDRFGRRVGGDGSSGRISGASVIGNRKKPRVIPGSFDDEDSDDEDDEAKNKHATADPSAVVEDKKDDMAEDEARKFEQEQEEQKRKEREAIRRKLELNKAKRRSSVGVAGARGRVSVGRGGVLLKPQPAPKPSRFGFFSSAKSLVQKVWNGGKTATAPPITATGSAIPKPSAKFSKAAPPQPSAPTSKKVPSIGSSRPSIAPRPLGRVPSLRTEKEKPTATVTSTSSRARSPIPPFGPSSSSTRSSLVKSSRGSLVMGTGTSTKNGAEISSMGTRSSLASSNKSGSSSNVSSMGSKKLSTGIAGRANAAAEGSSNSRIPSRRSSSRLLAPTASSLAKTARPSGSGLKTVAEAATGNAKPHNGEALGMITNTPTTEGPWSPRRGGSIFSQPLATPCGIPTPVKKGPPVEAFKLTGLSQQQTSGSLGDSSAVTKTADRTLVTGLVPARQRSITGRKPRISRSKVIAKLASQRAAGVGVPGPAGGTPSARGPAAVAAGRTRSSLGAKVQQRSSFGGKVGSTKTTGEGVLLSAKKRARQSEYARRRSRITPADSGASLNDMEVDAI